MAWQDITYKCGHEGREQLYGPEKDRKRKAEWMSKERLCPECYKAQKREEEKQVGLTVRLRVDHVAAATLNTVEFVAVFDGDTYPHKDALKEIGARWTDDYPGEDIAKSLLGMSSTRKRWCLRFGSDEAQVKETLEKITAVGARVVETPNEMDVAWCASSVCHAR